MSRPSSFTRREFLKTTTAGAAAISAGVFTGVAPAQSTSANEKLKIACIGTANQARFSIGNITSEDIVAVCDIDSTYLDRAKADFPNAKLYSDYRELLETEADRIDAVTVAIADHNHAPATIRAIRKKLHVYCEKPLTHSVHEARLIAEESKKYGVATQMGTQIHAGENYRRVVEIIQSGAIGDVTDVHVWVGKGWGGGELPKESEISEPPKTLNWDLWLGPAAERPFAAGRYHPAQWRRWWAFGQGTLGDMGCHYMDLPFWALNLRHPISARAEGPEVHPETCPLGLKVEYQFPKRGDLAACKLTWYDGDMIPKEVAGERVPGSGVMFIGTEGHMFADYSRYKLYPGDKFEAYEPPAATIPRSIGHHAEWIKACKDGSPTTCNFDYSGALTETVLLGNVAYRTGEALEWDAKNLKATNCGLADQYIRKEYRKGWEVV